MAKHRAKVRAERGIHLNGHHRPRHSEQRFRQNPPARADLQDRLARLEFRKANDLADDVRIDEEVLSERPARSDPVPVRQGTELRGSESRSPTS